jgi:hypothetical protein
LVADCQALVQGFEATEAARAPYRNKFAGYWQVAHQVISDIHKVKSHMTKAQAEGLGQLVWWHGNSTVDWLANLALPQYPEVDLAEFTQADKQQKLTLRQVCQHLSQVEKLTPLGKLLKEHPRTKAGRDRSQVRKSISGHGRATDDVVCNAGSHPAAAIFPPSAPLAQGRYPGMSRFTVRIA